MLGVSEATIVNWELGKTNPGKRDYVAIADFVGLPVLSMLLKKSAFVGTSGTIRGILRTTC